MSRDRLAMMIHLNQCTEILARRLTECSIGCPFTEHKWMNRSLQDSRCCPTCHLELKDAWVCWLEWASEQTATFGEKHVGLLLNNKETMDVIAELVAEKMRETQVIVIVEPRYFEGIRSKLKASQNDENENSED